MSKEVKEVPIGLGLSNTRVLSGNSYIMFLPVDDAIAYSIDDHRVYLANGETRYRFDNTIIRISRVEDFIKMLLQRTLTPPRMMKVSEFSAEKGVDQGSVRRFCRTALGRLYGAASLTRERASWRIPGDIPVEVVLLARLAKGKRFVPAADLIMAALMAGHGRRGSTTRELCERLRLNYDAARKAVYILKRRGLVVSAGRGKVKIRGENDNG